MDKALEQIFAYLNYYLRARSKYKVHSPFVYDFVVNVMHSKEIPEACKKIEEIRNDLKRRNDVIVFQDFGAGSNKFIVSDKRVKIKALAHNSTVSRKFGLLLYHIVKHYNMKNILELGTSFGIGSMYLALADKDVNLTTIEGDQNIAKIAEDNFAKEGFTNIKLVRSDFDAKLDAILNDYENLDLVYIDGNHKYGPTLRYFKKCLTKSTNNSIFILDDIRWSKEMYKAWKDIISHPEVSISIDIFRMGLVFFRKESVKQDFLIRF